MYEVVWPRGKKDAEIVCLAKRLDSLEGKTICELWDWMFHGDKIFPMLEAELTKRYPTIKFVNYEKFGSTHGAYEAKVIASLSGKLKENECDAVISAMGC
ncbi:hypothetical protein ACFLTZ_07230 [Chloroflexota bacterium]